MKTIKLTQGKVALVDDADYEAVSQYRWHAQKMGRCFYAARSVKKPDGRPAYQFLHHFLMPGVARIDHRDGNGCNDQRKNIRPATKRQNSQGARQKKIGATARFRGVVRHRCGKWQSQITVDGKQIYLGLSTSEIEAAKVYDKAAREFFKEFACPNFPI